MHRSTCLGMYIRSAHQDVNYGTYNIVLPCPGAGSFYKYEKVM
jgi:hypothetical protein